MDKNQAIELILNENYCSINDLRYNQKIGIMQRPGNIIG